MSDSSIKERYSRYTQGGVTDVYSNRLGWWDRQAFPFADDDISVTLSPRYARRPDMVAYDFYGKTSLMWIVLQYNNILDINTEFVEGKEIIIPSRERVLFDLTTKQNTGNFI